MTFIQGKIIVTVTVTVENTNSLYHRRAFILLKKPEAEVKRSTSLARTAFSAAPSSSSCYKARRKRHHHHHSLQEQRKSLLSFAGEVLASVGFYRCRYSQDVYTLEHNTDSEQDHQSTRSSH